MRIIHHQVSSDDETDSPVMQERLATIAKGPGDLVQRKELVEENAERHRSPSTCAERRDGVALLSRLERGSSSIELCAWHPPPLLSVARERLRALLASFWHQGMLSLWLNKAGRAAPINPLYSAVEFRYMNAEDWNQTNIVTSLASLPLGRIQFFSSVASTNDMAARLASENAPDLTLVVAGQQTAGKGRAGRKWFSPPDASIALSLALRPQLSLAESQEINSLLLRYTALGALAVCDALHTLYQLPAEIKWPNDVLIKERKVCGVLAEAHWLGNQLEAIILGIGINVLPQAIPPKNDLQFPATCIQEHVKQEITRMALLSQVIGRLIFWRSHIQSPAFIQSWEELLAFRHQWIKVVNQTPEKTEQIITGKLVGLDSEGRLVLEDSTGTPALVQFGELQLRPV